MEVISKSYAERNKLSNINIEYNNTKLNPIFDIIIKMPRIIRFSKRVMKVVIQVAITRISLLKYILLIKGDLVIMIAALFVVLSAKKFHNIIPMSRNIG